MFPSFYFLKFVLICKYTEKYEHHLVKLAGCGTSTAETGTVFTSTVPQDRFFKRMTSTGRSDAHCTPQGLTAVANGNNRKKTN
jgi:hypothetical protein